MAIVFAEKTQRRRISRIHQVRPQVKLVGRDILCVQFRKQPLLHRAFNDCALTALENRRREDAGDIGDAQLLQLFRGIIRLFLEQALLVDYRLVDRNRAVLVTGFHFVGGIFQLATNRGLALLHLGVDQLLDIGDFQLAVGVFDFVDGRAVSFRQDRHWQF